MRCGCEPAPLVWPRRSAWHGRAYAGIHMQNPDDDPLFDFSRAMWNAAAERAPGVGGGHHVSIGCTEADFAAAMTEAVSLICDVSVIKNRFPCAAPRLKLLFVTNAGLDRIAPYDWLPAGVILMNNRGTHAAKAGEFGIMAVLMLANLVPEMVTHQRVGQWHKLWGNVVGGSPVTYRLGASWGARSHVTRRRSAWTSPAFAPRPCRIRIAPAWLVPRHWMPCCRARSSLSWPAL